MHLSDTPKPSEEEIESESQPQKDPKHAIPEENDSDVEETEKQPT